MSVGDTAAPIEGVDDGTIPCTAHPTEDRDRPNVLFTPPCPCPRCRPDQHFDHGPGTDGWIRVPGRRQRLRVERLVLGSDGRRALG